MHEAGNITEQSHPFVQQVSLCPLLRPGEFYNAAPWPNLETCSAHNKQAIKQSNWLIWKPFLKINLKKKKKQHLWKRVDIITR